MRQVWLCVIVVFLLASVAFGQGDDHTHEGNPWDIYAVHGANGEGDNGFCSNIDGNDNGRDVDCIDRGPNGPREWSTTCGFPDSSSMECSASATVHCPGLGIGSGPGIDYINFSCYQDSIPEVSAGILEGFGQFPQKKGVLCRNGATGSTASCGCVTTSTAASYFFGNPQALSVANYYICQ